LKVLYSIAAKFGGTGIGRAASRSVVDIADQHDLSIAATAFDCAVPGRASEVRIRIPRRWPLTNKKEYRFKRAMAFDSSVAGLLSDEVDVFNSWNGHCLEGLEKAGKLGITTIVVRASSHMLTQMEILKEEFARFGVEQQVELPAMIDRCCREYEAADYVQVPSEFVLRSFLDRGYPECKLILIPFGVDSSKYAPSMSKDGVFRALFVGRIGLRKGVQYLLEAWKKLDFADAELVLAGNVEPGFGDTIKRYAGLRNVSLRGFVKDPVGLFSSASVFVFPSLEEGSALVTYEAMASALPVVTTFNSGSLVRDSVDGFIVPIRDAELLADRLSRLYDDRNFAHEMGGSGRDRVSEYTWERYSRALAGFYAKIGEARNGAGRENNE
jgi:glycosyltransferase involved in cell wall biosynthesis